jgi:cysteine-rich repeat protein
MLKRGQSEILITVILILVVIAAIVTVGVFIKNSITKGAQESETRLQIQTMNLKFDIKSVFINRSDNRTLWVNVFRESGSQENIDSLKFIFLDKNGNSYSYVDTVIASGHKALETKAYTITAVNLGISSLENITRVWIYYGLNSSSGSFVFSNLLDEYGYNTITKEGDIDEIFIDEETQNDEDSDTGEDDEEINITQENKVELLSITGSLINNFTTIQECANIVSAGQTCLVYPGTYRETVIVKNSGTINSPVTFKSKELHQAIIDGTEILGGWQRCSSSDQCFNNSKWFDIYYASAPSGFSVHRGLFLNDTFLSPSQYPNQPDFRRYDNLNNFISIAKSQVSSTTANTSIIDAVNLCPVTGDETCDSQYFRGSYILFWRNPNIVELRKVLGYEPNLHKITFEYIDPSNLVYETHKYSIYNNPQNRMMDSYGEYYFDVASNRVYLLTQTIQGINAMTRLCGVNIDSKSYLNIEGFTVKKMYGGGANQAIGIGSCYSTGESVYGINIKNNDITLFKHLDKGYGGIHLKGCNDCLIANNYLNEFIGTYSIFMSGGYNWSIYNNTLFNTDAITTYSGKNSRIISNDIRSQGSVHSNSITIYKDSWNILVANNFIYEGKRIALSGGDGFTKNVTIMNNIFDARGYGDKLIDKNGNTSGNILVFNNLFLNSISNDIISFSGDDAITNLVVKNNIQDGGTEGDIRSNNIFTASVLLNPNEYLEEELSRLFVDIDNLDYRPIADSIAINRGIDVMPDLINAGFVNMFPDYDFTKDITGRTRPYGSNWDIGPYEYTGGAYQLCGNGNINLIEEQFIDNLDASCSFGGTWATGTTVSGYYGLNYAHDNNAAADPVKYARYSFNNATGKYKVYLRWTSQTNRPDAAPVYVYYKDGRYSTLVNQQVNGSIWNLIGNFDLNSSSYLIINASDVGSTIADAVKIEEYEECDDGNLINGDGCSSTCTIG